MTLKECVMLGGKINKNPTIQHNHNNKEVQYSGGPTIDKPNFI